MQGWYMVDQALNAESARLLAALERYAGWLAKDRTSVALREHVESLRLAVGSSADVWPLIQLLDADLQRLPGGAVRKLLKTALTELSPMLDPGGRARSLSESESERT